jgi:hypothetical protein
MANASTLSFMGVLFVASAALYATLPEDGPAVRALRIGALPARADEANAPPSRSDSIRDIRARKILSAAEYAKLAPNDHVNTSVRSIEVVYRLINERLPVYADTVGAVLYDEEKAGVQALATGERSLHIIVGRNFIDATGAASLDRRVQEIEQAVRAIER